jgi:hypothetical protein
VTKTGAALVAVAVGALSLGHAGRAPAGAPNYECRIGTYRIGIDQHRGGVLLRADGGAAVAAAIDDAHQDGSSLDLSVTLGARPARISVRGTGTSAALLVGGRRMSGACAFVPGDFALGRVSVGAIAVRSTRDDGASVLAVLRRGSLVWAAPSIDAAGAVGQRGLAPVRAVLRIRGGAAGGAEPAIDMGAAAGLDGRSSVIDGWASSAGVTLLGSPGP